MHHRNRRAMGNQSSRSGVYQQYYTALENPDAALPANINPYDVLGVGPNFTWDELKVAYRRAARLAHPDKGGTEKLFEVVTESFRKLGEDYKFRQGGRPHHELKRDSEAYWADRGGAGGPSGSGSGGAGGSAGPSAPENPRARDFAGGANFAQRFNETFEEHRLDDDETARGYADMMEKSSVKREDIAVSRTINGKYNRRKFNEHFEKETAPGEDSEVIVYREPEPMVSARTMQFTELGNSDTQDFSGGAEEARRGLQYTDYKVAHSTTRLVDPRAVAERRQFKSVEEYEAYRAKKTHRQLTEQELEWMASKKAEEEAAERARLSRLRERDERQALHHEKMNQLMLR